MRRALTIIGMPQDLVLVRRDITDTK